MSPRNGNDREETVVLPYCQYHHEHKSQIGRNASDIQDLWKAIDKMKTAVIVGSFSMILALVGVVGQYVLHFQDKKTNDKPPTIIVNIDPAAVNNAAGKPKGTGLTP